MRSAGSRPAWCGHMGPETTIYHLQITLWPQVCPSFHHALERRRHGFAVLPIHSIQRADTFSPKQLPHRPQLPWHQYRARNEIVRLFGTLFQTRTPLYMDSARADSDTLKSCITAASFGAVGGIFALQFFSEVPKVRTEIMQVRRFRAIRVIRMGRKADTHLCRECQSLGNTMRGKCRPRIMYVIPRCDYGYGEVMLLILWRSRSRSCEEWGRGSWWCRCDGGETASWCRLRLMDPRNSIVHIWSHTVISLNHNVLGVAAPV